MLQDDVAFAEAYDLNSDPYELRNLANLLNDERKADWRRRIETMESCAGSEQCEAPSI